MHLFATASWVKYLLGELSLSLGQWLLLILGAVVITFLSLWLWFVKTYQTLLKKSKNYRSQDTSWQELMQKTERLQQLLLRSELPHDPLRDASEFYGELDRQATKERERFHSHRRELQKLQQEKEACAQKLHFQHSIPPQNEVLSEVSNIQDDIQQYEVLEQKLEHAKECFDKLKENYAALKKLEISQKQRPQEVKLDIRDAWKMYSTLSSRLPNKGKISHQARRLVADLENAQQMLRQAETKVKAEPSQWEEIDAAEALRVKACMTLDNCKAALDKIDTICTRLQNIEELLTALHQTLEAFEADSQSIVQLETMHADINNWRKKQSSIERQFDTVDDVGMIQQDITDMESTLQKAKEDLSEYQRIFHDIVKPGLRFLAEQQQSTYKPHVGILLRAHNLQSPHALPKEIADLKEEIEQIKARVKHRPYPSDSDKIQNEFSELQGSYLEIIRDLLTYGHISAEQLVSIAHVYTHDMLSKIDQIQKHLKKLSKDLKQLENRRETCQKALNDFESRCRQPLENIARQTWFDLHSKANNILAQFEAVCKEVKTSSHIEGLNTAREQLDSIESQARDIQTKYKNEVQVLKLKVEQAKRRLSEQQSMWKRKEVGQSVPSAIRKQINRDVAPYLSTDVSEISHHKLQHQWHVLQQITSQVQCIICYQQRLEDQKRQLRERMLQLEKKHWRNIQFQNPKSHIRQQPKLKDCRSYIAHAESLETWFQQIDQFAEEVKRQLARIAQAEQEIEAKIEKLQSIEDRLTNTLLKFYGEAYTTLSETQIRTLEKLHKNLDNLQTAKNYQTARRYMVTAQTILKTSFNLKRL